jgi:hypothetical protein
MKVWLDSAEAAAALGVTEKEFRQLRKNPFFPKYRGEWGLDDEWKAADITAFRRELDECAARGWKVPECLYPWQVDFPRTRAEKEVRWQKIMEKMEARRAWAKG